MDTKNPDSYNEIWVEQVNYKKQRTVSQDNLPS